MYEMSEMSEVSKLQAPEALRSIRVADADTHVPGVACGKCASRCIDRQSA
jgi:hypothetical protein